MNAAALACAPSGTSWDGIDWIAVQRRVKGLQARIVPLHRSHSER